jgi:GntR family transcriptional regulator of arabinose operon
MEELPHIGMPGTHMPQKTVTKKARTPKYVQLAQQLREQVKNGERKPGERLPTFAQMRAEFGLTQTTLERMYHLLEAENIVMRAPGKGVFIATPQRRSQGIIGFCSCPISEQHPYYAHLLQGVREVIHEAGWELLLTHDKTSIKWEKVDGVLIGTPYIGNIINGLPPMMPCFSLLHHIDDAPCVTTDNYGGIRQAMRHLLELGHRNLAYLTNTRPNLEDNVQQKRLRGYRDALRDAGIELKPGWLRDHRDPSEPMQKWAIMGRQKTERWLQTDWEQTGCTAILALNDEVAIGVIEALRGAGLKVPEDVSVVGFDGTEIAEYYQPRLTTVEVPLREIGAHSARLLLDRIAAPLDHERGKEVEPPQETVLLARLRIGQSTAPVKS